MVRVMEMGKEQIEPKREQAQENYLQKMQRTFDRKLLCNQAKKFNTKLQPQ